MANDLLQPTILDRLLTSFRALVRAEFPQLTYCVAWEMTITAVRGKKVDVTPLDTTAPIGAMSNVDWRASSGLDDSSALPPTLVGNRCIMQFLNADPSRPAVTHCDAIALTLPTARLGDAAGPFVITTASLYSKTG